MPYQVLSLKWRPQTFADLVGQKHVSQTLINALKRSGLSTCLDRSSGLVKQLLLA